MSRIKSRAQTEICGDCGASGKSISNRNILDTIFFISSLFPADPSWASINRGILLCAECCSVHRSLGRHISQVKSLRQGKWTPSVLNLVNSLTSLGVNTSVWEHSLQDAAKYPKNGRKPQPKDAVHPNKAEFVRAKHVNFNFVLKPAQDGDWQGNLESELNRQLHASVRAPNLETSLRLLSQGADPNFYHEEKGSTPLHMAARSGQAMQVELLLVFGADILVPDSNQQTAIDLAKANKHLAIAERLTEATYEVTDRLCYFLCNRRPDHAANQHIIVPDQNGVDISEPLKIARGKLLLIPNKMFEELVMDLYDEVDRRETESIWSTSALNPEIGAVPFLPVNPLLSATRNQGRQKLARFSAAQFAGLLTDVLIDAKRRQNMANLRPSLSK